MIIVSRNAEFEIDGFTSNRYGEHSPEGYNLISVFMTEIVMTFMFLIIILGQHIQKLPKDLQGWQLNLA